MVGAVDVGDDDDVVDMADVPLAVNILLNNNKFVVESLAAVVVAVPADDDDDDDKAAINTTAVVPSLAALGDDDDDDDNLSLVFDVVFGLNFILTRFIFILGDGVNDLVSVVKLSIVLILLWILSLIFLKHPVSNSSSSSSICGKPNRWVLWLQPRVAFVVIIDNDEMADDLFDGDEDEEVLFPLLPPPPSKLDEDDKVNDDVIDDNNDVGNDEDVDVVTVVTVPVVVAVTNVVVVVVVVINPVLWCCNNEFSFINSIVSFPNVLWFVAGAAEPPRQGKQQRNSVPPRI